MRWGRVAIAAVLGAVVLVWAMGRWRIYQIRQQGACIEFAEDGTSTLEIGECQ